MQHRYTSIGDLPPWRQYDVIQLWEDQDTPSLPPLPPWSTVPSKRAMNDDEENEARDGEQKRLRGRPPALEVSSPIDDSTPPKTVSHIASPSTRSIKSTHAAQACDHLDNTSPFGKPSNKSNSPYTAIKQIIKHMQGTSMAREPATDANGFWNVPQPTKATHTESIEDFGPMPLPELVYVPEKLSSDDSSISLNSEGAATGSSDYPKRPSARKARSGGCHHYPQHDIGDDKATIRCLRAELQTTTRQRDSLQTRLDKQTAKLTLSDQQVDKLRIRNNNQKVALRSLEAKVHQNKVKGENGEGQGKKQKLKAAAKTDQRLLEENGQLQLKLKDQKATIAVLGSELKDLKVAAAHRDATRPPSDTKATGSNDPWQFVDDQSVLDQLAALKAKEEWWRSEKQLLDARVADAGRWREEKEAEWVSSHKAWERQRVG